MERAFGLTLGRAGKERHALAVGSQGKVLRHAGPADLRWRPDSWLASAERIALYGVIRRHNAVIEAEKQEFVSRPRPGWEFSAFGRYLPLAARPRKRPHENFLPAQFARSVGQKFILLLRQEKPAARPLRFSIHAPDGATGVVSRPAISPDGENVVFNAVAGGETHLYLNSLATGLTRQLAGTEGGGSATWSFDSRALLLSRGTDPLGAALVRMDLSGAPPQPLALPFQPSALQDWGPEGVVSGRRDGGLYWFQPDGSGVRQLRAPGPEQAGGIRAPSLIPGSRWLIYNSRKVGSGIATPTAIHLASLDGKTDRLLFTTDSNYGFYAAPGYILYLQGTALMARPLDPKSGQLRGEALSVVEGVGDFSTSANGVLAYRPGTAAADSQLTWFDRSGNNLGAVGSPAEFSSPALSPDGNRVAAGIRDPAAKTRDIWVLDLSRGSQSKLTFDPKDDLSATWSPDGSRIAFTSDRRGARDLYVKSASGTGDDELLLESKLDKNIEAWSPDGRTLIYNQASHDLWTWSFDTRKAQPFLPGKSVALHGRFSPDGKWVAYTSYESGRPRFMSGLLRMLPPARRDSGWSRAEAAYSPNGGATARNCFTLRWRSRRKSWPWISRRGMAPSCTAPRTRSSTRVSPQVSGATDGWPRGTGRSSC